MPIADLATASSETTGTSLSFSHTVVAGTDKVLWVCVDSWRNTSFVDPTGVTYGGVALTKLSGNFLGGGGNDNPCSVWRLINPTAGAANVVVTHAQSHDITALSYSRTGVDQTTPNDTVQALDSADTDPTHSVTSATGDLVVSFIMGWNWVNLGEDGDLTIQLANTNSTGLNSIAVGDAAGAASVNASWTTDTYADPFGLFSFNINASGGAGPQTINPASVASAEAFGTPTLTPGAVSISPTGIATAEALGSPTITATFTLSPASITSGEAFGAPTLTPGGVTVSPTAIASGEVMGSPSVTNDGGGGQTVNPSSILSAEAFGTVRLDLVISPTGIGSAEALGAPSITVGGVTVSLAGIPSAEAFGAPALVPGAVTVSPTGIPSAQAFGTPVLHQLIAVSGIVSGEAFGTVTFVPGSVTITPVGIPSAAAFGNPVLIGGEAPEVGQRITVVVGISYGGFHGYQGPRLG